MAIDERAYGSFSRLAWGYGLGCLVVGCQTRDCRPDARSTHPIECCHVDRAGGEGGMGLKARYTSTVFMCWRHHDQLDRELGPRLFSEVHRLRVGTVDVKDLKHAARETERQFQIREHGLAF